MTATPTLTAFISYPGTARQPSLLDVTIKSSGVLNPQYPSGGTIYDAWCLIEHIDLPVPATYAAFLYSSYELGNLVTSVPTLAGSKMLGNLDNINWLLNYYNGSNAAYGDVQGAIWKMMGSAVIVDYVGPQSQAKIDALVGMALAHDGFVPGAGDKIGLILDPMQGSTHRQPLIVESLASAIGDYVWHDTNANGRQDGGESGIAGATVRLVRDQNLDGDFSDANEVIASTTTDAAGAYVFKGLTPGLTYQVQFSLPAGYDATSTRQADGSAASGANSDAMLSDRIVLAPGQSLTSIDAGFYKQASLGDRLWLDTNGNGQQDESGTGITGTQVTLISGGADGLIATVLDNASTSVTTGADGAYLFANLKPGTQYQVQFARPDGTSFTGQNSGADATDSDVSRSGLSQVITLASGENNRTIDAGVTKPASLGDRVWLDANGNGQQDIGEAGIDGAEVTLLSGGDDGLLATTVDNTSTSVTTGLGGAYAFTGLVAGTEYQVQFAALAGALFTNQDAGLDVSDSDADSSGRTRIIKLASGEDNVTIDAGLYVPGSIGDRVWLDANANGQQDDGEAGVDGVAVTLIGAGADGVLATIADNSTRTVTTARDGSYLFDGLAPGQYQVQFSRPEGTLFTRQDSGDDSSDSDAGIDSKSQIITLASGQHLTTIDAGVYTQASLGDRVWLDANANGQQDAGEAGVAGLSVTLTGGGLDGLLATTQDNTSASTTTSADGAYGFAGLTPGVEYQVQFAKPADAVFTGSNIGVDASDSDAAANGLSQIVKLASGEANNTIDAGFYVPASIGDRLWVDTNANGQQDDGATGIAGAAVTLIGGGADGIIATAADNTSRSTVTGADGAYAFTGLTPGIEYQLQFAAPQGSVFTAKDIGDDASDSDVSATGLSQVVTLASGENNRSIDAGVYTQASLGDRVWLDANANGQQDAGEAGVAGLSVTLTGGGLDGLLATTQDNTSASTTTSADGAYGFAGLTPGVEYQVQFAKPADAVFTGSNIGVDASDSDAAANGLSQIVKLASGEANNTIDAGFYVPASIGDRLWVDTNANGQQDDGATGIAGAAVTLIGGGADGIIATAADNTSRSTVTGADGAYAFTGLTPGIEYQLQFAAPQGSVFTAKDIGDDASDSDVSATGLSQVVTLASGENNRSIDAGVYTQASLGDRVWLDANANGQQDAGEAGVAGLSVTLTGGGLDGLLATTQDNTSASTTTSADGAYGFAGLTPGVEYQVQFAKPADAVFTGSNIGVDASDSDAAANGLSQIVKLASGEANNTIDAGFYVPASIGDRLWVDTNANGQQDDGATGIAGAAVTLTGGGLDGLIATTADNTSTTTTTGADGYYQFKNLTPGQYQLQFAKPADMLFTKQNTGSDASDSDVDAAGTSQIVTLVAGESNSTVDAGVYATASVGDRLWIDTNANGQQDDGATGLAGRTVTLAGGGTDGLLSTGADNTSVSMLTEADGAYSFGNLTPGVQYQVQFSKPAGYVYSTANSGDDLSDSDAAATTGVTQIVVLKSGEYNKSLDAGIVNVTGDLAITKTDGLASVVPGQNITYSIVVKNNGTAPALDALVADAIPASLTNVTWTSSASPGASGNLASGTGSINDYITLTGGASVTYTVNAKVAPLSALEKVSDFGALANNTNLGQNTTVNAIRADAAFVSGGLVYSADLWERNAGTDKGLGVLSYGEVAGSTGSHELSAQRNAEVIRLTKGAGEQWTSLWVSSLDPAGTAGADAGTLYWSNSPTPDLTTLTTRFTFKNGDFGVGADAGNLLSLRPAGFDAQAQYVFFVACGATSDYLVWKAGTIPTQIGNTASVTGTGTFIDSNGANNSATDVDSVSIPLAPAIVRGSIGNLVWEDNNYNGIKDSGEAGIANVTVKLLDVNNLVLATTVTNSGGGYVFNNLNGGSYKIEVVEPGNYFVTKANIGVVDSIDSDIDVITGRSGTITLTQGEHDMNWDAGLYRKASIGDKVWRDVDHDDIQDVGEEGIPGVKVMLYSAAGTLLATQTTNLNGNYKFSNLDPGSYFLKFDKSNVLFKTYDLDNWMWGSKNVGLNDAVDSDVLGDGVAKTGLTRTDVTTLVSGENDMSWDAAITPIVIDLNGDGVHTVARSASSATFDLLGTGKAIASGWLSSSDGFLAVDVNGNGSIDSIAELFGGAAKGTGFARLATFDCNGDGAVNAQDADFGSLRIWQDANGNRITDSGELLSLADAGVMSLTVAHTDLPFLDAQGNLHIERSSATLSSGQHVDMTDVYFAINAADAQGVRVQGVEELLAETAAASNVMLVGVPADDLMM